MKIRELLSQQILVPLEEKEESLSAFPDLDHPEPVIFQNLSQWRCASQAKLIALVKSGQPFTNDEAKAHRKAAADEFQRRFVTPMDASDNFFKNQERIVELFGVEKVKILTKIHYGNKCFKKNTMAIKLAKKALPEILLLFGKNQKISEQIKKIFADTSLVPVAIGGHVFFIKDVFLKSVRSKSNKINNEQFEFYENNEL